MKLTTIKIAAIAAIVWASPTVAEYAANQSSNGLAVGPNVDEGGGLELAANLLTPLEALKLKVEEATNALQLQMAEASISGSKSDQVRVATNAIRGSKALVEEAVTQSEAIKAEVQNKIDFEHSQEWIQPLMQAFDQVMDQARKVLDHQYPHVSSLLSIETDVITRVSPSLPYLC